MRLHFSIKNLDRVCSIVDCLVRAIKKYWWQLMNEIYTARTGMTFTCTEKEPPHDR